jgi:hypothetical protein
MAHEAELIIPPTHPAYRRIATILQHAAIGQAQLDLMAARSRLQDAVAAVYGDDLAQSVSELIDFGVQEAAEIISENREPEVRSRRARP